MFPRQLRAPGCLNGSDCHFLLERLFALLFLLVHEIKAGGKSEGKVRKSYRQRRRAYRCWWWIGAVGNNRSYSIRCTWQEGVSQEWVTAICNIRSLRNCCSSKRCKVSLTRWLDLLRMGFLFPTPTTKEGTRKPFETSQNSPMTAHGAVGFFVLVCSKGKRIDRPQLFTVTVALINRGVALLWKRLEVPPPDGKTSKDKDKQAV